MLGRQDELEAQLWDRAGVVPDPAGRELGRAEPLFSKISADQVAAEIAALGHRAAGRHDAGTGKDKTAMNDQDKTAVSGLPALRPEITIDDFLKCDFRLGRIVDAEKVPGSKRLLKFTVDIGLDTRTILAGIQEHYDPETLVGKTVVVIANLAPRRMMGYDSQGMVLAAEVDGTLTVLTPFSEGLRPGAQLS
jgi:methionyl-tRNA synthetase